MNETPEHILKKRDKQTQALSHVKPFNNALAMENIYRGVGLSKTFCSKSIRHDFGCVSCHKTVPVSLLASCSTANTPRKCNDEIIAYLKS